VNTPGIVKPQGCVEKMTCYIHPISAFKPKSYTSDINSENKSMKSNCCCLILYCFTMDYTYIRKHCQILYGYKMLSLCSEMMCICPLRLGTASTCIFWNAFTRKMSFFLRIGRYKRSNSFVKA
jgi:hypothetical protein